MGGVYPSFFFSLLLATWLGGQETHCKALSQELNTDPVDLDKFRQDSLAAHNSYRAKHGVAALKISAELNALAQEWAEKLIAEYKFGDSLPHRGPGGPGENIYTSIGMAAQEQAQGAVDNWYSEIKDYTYGKEPSTGGSEIVHFTQVVWKGSTVVVVANYSPPGNVRGQYAENVPPPR